MNKKFVYYFLAVVLVSALPKTTQILYSHFSPKEVVKVCPIDTNTCPDGTVVTRALPTCDFTLCPILETSPLPLNTEEEISTSTTLTINEPTTIEEKTLNSVEKSTQPPQENTTKKTVTSRISSIIQSVTQTIASSFTSTPVVQTGGNPLDHTIPASSYITSSSSQTETSVYKTLPPSDFAGQKYLVEGNNIISNDNKVIYTIPPEVITAVSSSNTGWTNTTINVIPVGTIPPILNAIPIKDLPGKYYLSENSFGNMEACEFSNKIFILDTYTNTVTLMYEENNTTLSHDDPRACNSEIFLLATEGVKLVLKYHTIGTGTLCDSAWSEPDKTFFLDVTKLQTEGMKHYTIPENLSVTAEQEEEACRATLQQ